MTRQMLPLLCALAFMCGMATAARTGASTYAAISAAFLLAAGVWLVAIDVWHRR